MFMFKHMVVKTITITEDAYNVLKRMKKSNQSFSELIIEFSEEKKGHLINLFGILKDKSKDMDELQEKSINYRKDFDSDSLARIKKLKNQYDNS